jgi:hypothetical protein
MSGVAHEIHTSDVRSAAETRYLHVKSGFEGLRTEVMKTSTRISRAGWTVAVALLLQGLHGCGSSSSASGDVAHSGAKKVAHQVADPSNRAPEDMVAAVTAGKGGPPVGLRFEVRSSPEAGQPVDVDLAILPNAVAIDHIDGQIQGGESVSVVEGGDIPAVEKPAQGTVIRHVVRLLPRQDGIFTLTAAINVDFGTESITRNFTIPLIVGDGLPELAAKSEVADAEPAAGTGPKSH